MALRPAKIDYTGRTVDLLLLKTVYSPVPDEKVSPNVADNPMMTTGIEKLVQRYAILFLTQVGTVTNVDEEGTEFMKNLGTGRIYNEVTLKSEANIANALVAKQIHQADSYLDTADDEALYKSEITSVEISRSTATVTVTVKITAKSGDEYTYIAPIATGV